MARIGLKLTVVLMLTLSFVSSAWSAENIKQIVCIGDDITKGIWRDEMVGNGTRWVDVLASYDKNLDVVNAGMEGMLAGDVRYLNEILKQYPDADMYLIYLGVNDIKKIDKIDSGAAASIGAKVLRMLNTIKEHSPAANIAVIAPQRISESRLSDELKAKGLGEHSPVLSDLLSASLELAAEKEHVRFIDLLNIITPDMLPDGVRPNVEGHAKIAKVIWKEISHPYEDKVSIDNTIVVAPPPVGSPSVSEIGTEDIVSGVTSDIQDLQGIGSSVEVPVKVTDSHEARARSYVDKALLEGVITKPAYSLGESVGEKLVSELQSSLEGDVNAVMEAQFASLDNGESEAGNTVEITYKLPIESRVESYITAVDAEGEGYETLAEAVDWDEVKLERAEGSSNSVTEEAQIIANVVEEKVVVEAVQPVEQNIEELTQGDVINSNHEIVELWLPEFDVLDGMNKAVEVASSEELNNAERLVEAINTEEVREVVAESEAIEYTGYAVFIHTGISE